jgi:hypothetical protein
VLRVRVADKSGASDAEQILAEGFADDPTLGFVFREPQQEAKRDQNAVR